MNKGKDTIGNTLAGMVFCIALALGCGYLAWPDADLPANAPGQIIAFLWGVTGLSAFSAFIWWRKFLGLLRRQEEAQQQFASGALIVSRSVVVRYESDK